MWMTTCHGNAAAILKHPSFVNQMENQMDSMTDAKESKDESNADSLVLTNETFDFQMTDGALDLEDHIDEY